MARADAGRNRATQVDDAVALGQRSALFAALGTILATLALILGLLALSASAAGGASTTAAPWVIALLACTAVMGVVCVVQQRLWNLAWRRWESDIATGGVERASWVLHLVSYAVVVLGIFAGIAASHDVGFAGTVSTFATLALVPFIAAQVLGAVQLVRRSGPPGTVPTYVRRLSARIERSRRED